MRWLSVGVSWMGGCLLDGVAQCGCLLGGVSVGVAQFGCLLGGVSTDIFYL